MNILRYALFAAIAMLPLSVMAKKTSERPVDDFAYEVLRNPENPILLISIKELANKQWNQGDPPKPLIRVHGVIGSHRVPMTFKATWSVLPADFSWATQEEQPKLLSEWKAQPIQIPFKDTKWYVALNGKEGSYSITPVLRVPASNALYKYISEQVGEFENNRPKKVRSIDEIEVLAARHARMQPWLESLNEVNIKELSAEAEMAALVSIEEMQPENRQISFSVVRTIKQPKDSAEPPETVKLAGFPDTFYSQLYDYSKLQDMPELLIFLKQASATSELGKPVAMFKPVRGAKSILPATEERLQQLGVKTKGKSR